jgi:hypothetical protein
VRASSPCLSAFIFDRAFPAADFGPVLRRAFFAFAFLRLDDVMGLVRLAGWGVWEVSGIAVRFAVYLVSQPCGFWPSAPWELIIGNFWLFGKTFLKLF